MVHADVAAWSRIKIARFTGKGAQALGNAPRWQGTFENFSSQPPILAVMDGTGDEVAGGLVGLSRLVGEGLQPGEALGAHAERAAFGFPQDDALGAHADLLGEVSAGEVELFPELADGG